MDAEKVRSELLERFPGIEEEALIQCISMCQMFNITPEDLRYKWEAMIYSSSVKEQPISFFTANCARDLRQQLQRDVAKASQAKAQTSRQTVAKRAVRGGGSFTSPSATRARVGVVKVEPSTPSLSSNPKVGGGRPVNFSLPPDFELYKCKSFLFDHFSYCTKPEQIAICTRRYMSERQLDVLLYTEPEAVLDEQIDNVAERVRQHYKLDELGDPSTVTLVSGSIRNRSLDHNPENQDDVVVVGRIVNDGDTKLGETSTLIESSRMMGMGARVPLEFGADLKIRCASRRGTGSTGFGLFPGMIVALKGKNGSGDSFVVSEILRLPPLPPAGKSDSNASLKAFIACGPFTIDSDLDYKPFTRILEATREERPDLLLLLGPFIDSNHPLIKTGQVDSGPAALFRERISKPLAQLEADIPELVTVLVPSPRDLISSHVVLPQAALERDPELGLSRKCQLVPNPGTFSVNGFTVGATSVDVLFHIRKDHFFKQAPEIADEPNSETADAMTMLCRQVLEQQREVHEDVNLSILHLDLLKIKGTAPDILVMPSRLKEFQKVVDSTVVVNPAVAAKFSSAGNAVCFSISRSTGTGTQHGMKLVKLGT
ncbi:DNA-directed DNA polymerase alpha subunit pol12 [Ceratobasidium sp. 370]|nr:DNA-directed DNA polymerase alpha subunit pol12 [Ceratobasidium sp. 370]